MILTFVIGLNQKCFFFFNLWPNPNLKPWNPKPNSYHNQVLTFEQPFEVVWSQNVLTVFTIEIGFHKYSNTSPYTHTLKIKLTVYTFFISKLL